MRESIADFAAGAAAEGYYWVFTDHGDWVKYGKYTNYFESDISMEDSYSILTSTVEGTVISTKVE